MTAAVVYRHYNANGKLLYVGMSLTFTARTLAHVYGAAWGRQIARIKLEHFDSKDDALVAEATAIQKERPMHNRRSNFATTIHRKPKP